MSAPVQDNIDRRSMYAPPWAKNEQSDDDARRIQAEIVAAAEQPEGQQKPSRAGPQQTHRARHDEAETDSARICHEDKTYRGGMAHPEEEQQFDLEDAIRGEWMASRLEPVRMPPPPKADGPTWGMLSRLTGAAGFAVIVAMFVTGAIPLPSINISLPRDDRGGKTAEPPPARPEAARQAASAPAAHAAQPSFAPRPAPPIPSTVGVAMSAPAPAITASIQPAARVEPPRPPQAWPDARGAGLMNRDEIESLLKRGHELLASGDIPGGRLLLTRAAEAGEPRASLALAGTYDAPVMAYLGVIDVPPDPVKARAWYMKAAAQGSPEASRRLERLAGR